MDAMLSHDGLIVCISCLAEFISLKNISEEFSLNQKKWALDHFFNISGMTWFGFVPGVFLKHVICKRKQDLR